MATAYMRDIAIIIVAVQSIVIGVLIAVLILQIWRLMKMVETEIKPVLDDLQETLSTVRGTTNFVGDNVVEPVAKTSGYIAGVRRTVGTMRNEITATMQTWRSRPSTTNSDEAAADAAPAGSSNGAAAEGASGTASSSATQNEA